MVSQVSRFGASAPVHHAVGFERIIAEGTKMKKLLLTLTAVAAFSGSAFAADLSPRTYTKAPPPAPTWNWTGFYIFGGGGGGVWDANTGLSDTATGACVSCVNNRHGGDGWFGTVGAGYDWQFNGRWVAGIFGDGQFGSLKGNVDFGGLAVGNVKLRDTWAVGGRIGYLVAPNVLSYVNGGYTGSEWSGSTFLAADTGLPVGLHTNSFNTQGWFVGGGVENNLDIFGITAPGWFMKTEYRAAYFDNKNLNVNDDATNLPIGFDVNFRPLVQTISTSLVYRFNWGGPVVAKY
jgi:outer membrane immunogenic protein